MGGENGTNTRACLVHKQTCLTVVDVVAPVVVLVLLVVVLVRGQEGTMHDASTMWPWPGGSAMAVLANGLRFSAFRRSGRFGRDCGHGHMPTVLGFVGLWSTRTFGCHLDNIKSLGLRFTALFWASSKVLFTLALSSTSPPLQRLETFCAFVLLCNCVNQSFLMKKVDSIFCQCTSVWPS